MTGGFGSEPSSQPSIWSPIASQASTSAALAASVSTALLSASVGSQVPSFLNLPAKVSTSLESESLRGRRAQRSLFASPTVAASNSPISVSLEARPAGSVQTDWPWQFQTERRSNQSSEQVNTTFEDKDKVAALSALFGVSPPKQPTRARAASLPPVHITPIDRQGESLFDILAAATGRKHSIPTPTSYPTARQSFSPVREHQSPRTALAAMSEEGQYNPSPRHRSRSTMAPVEALSPPGLPIHGSTSGFARGGGIHASSVPGNLNDTVWGSPASQTSVLGMETRSRPAPLQGPASPPGLGWDGQARSYNSDQSFRDDSRFGGIASTNVSPFTRDGAFLGNIGFPYDRPPKSTLGPVGSGRKRGDTIWSGARPMSYTQEAVDDEGSDDDTAPPTRSGATSRRHSLAAFTSSAIRTSQVGFNVPATATASSFRSDLTSPFSSLATPSHLRLDDDELVDSLNSLQLSFEQDNRRRQESPQRRDPSPRRSSPPRYNPLGQDLYDRPAPNLAHPSGNNLPPPNTFFQQQQNAFGYPTFASSPQAGRLNQLPPPGQAGPFAPNPPSGFPMQNRQQQFPQQAKPQQQFGFGSRPPPPSAPPSFQGPSSTNPYDPSNRPVYFGAQTHQEPDLQEFGRGIPLHQVPASSPLYIVEFKPGRTDIFYLGDPSSIITVGDVVIVEADRGKDLGTVVHDKISLADVQAFQKHQVDTALSSLAGAQGNGQPPNAQSISRLTREVHPKRLIGKASPSDLQLLASKASDEAKALALVQSKVYQKNLEMEVIGAEWQFDRRKLTLFYIADKRIDFRDLVKDLFRLYKTRIWMAPIEKANEAPSSLGW